MAVPRHDAQASAATQGHLPHSRKTGPVIAVLLGLLKKPIASLRQLSSGQSWSRDGALIQLCQHSCIAQQQACNDARG